MLNIKAISVHLCALIYVALRWWRVDEGRTFIMKRQWRWRTISARFVFAYA